MRTILTCMSLLMAAPHLVHAQGEQQTAAGATGKLLLHCVKEGGAVRKPNDHMVKVAWEDVDEQAPDQALDFPAGPTEVRLIMGKEIKWRTSVNVPAGGESRIVDVCAMQISANQKSAESPFMRMFMRPQSALFLTVLAPVAATLVGGVLVTLGVVSITLDAMHISAGQKAGDTSYTSHAQGSMVLDIVGTVAAVVIGLVCLVIGLAIFAAGTGAWFLWPTAGDVEPPPASPPPSMADPAPQSVTPPAPAAQ